jgi:hypothetical protein
MVVFFGLFVLDIVAIGMMTACIRTPAGTITDDYRRIAVGIGIAVIAIAISTYGIIVCGVPTAPIDPTLFRNGTALLNG